jgi:hypothetical protein
MPTDVDIKPLPMVDRRVTDGKILDIVDYPFEVLKGVKSSIVRVGITGQSHTLGDSKSLRREELVQAASDWLRSRIAKGECDPWTRPDTDCMIDVPP